MTAHGLEFLSGVGKATTCVGYGHHRPVPLRFIWHHVLPLACGGRTVPDNLVQLCDSCHYSVHILLWQMAAAGGFFPPAQGTKFHRAIAVRGYNAAVAAGTVHLIPKEA
jgi:hypothetical protein